MCLYSSDLSSTYPQFRTVKLLYPPSHMAVISCLAGHRQARGLRCTMSFCVVANAVGIARSIRSSEVSISKLCKPSVR